MAMRPLFVRAMGLACPVGKNARAAVAAMRAGINRFARLPYLDDDHEELRGSRLSCVDTDVLGVQRWMALLELALDDVLTQVPAEALRGRPAIVVVPDGDALEPTTAAGLQERFEVLAGCELRVVDGDAASSYVALASARELAKDGPVLVCAAQSLAHARPLARLARGRRLLTERNADGVLPSEAAACAVLSYDPSHSRGAVVGIGVGEEPGLLDNDVPLRADGLRDAARGALREAGFDLHQIDFRLSDLTGEGYFFKEQALLVTRVLRQRREDFPLWACASSLGHVGAAAGLVNLAWALESHARGATPGRLALACAGGDVGRRACVVLHCGGRAKG